MSDWLQNSYLFDPKYSVCLLIAVGSGMLPSKMFSGEKMLHKGYSFRTWGEGNVMGAPWGGLFAYLAYFAYGI